ncbi:hypothetical protein [Rubritalea tangerina]|uniref:DUF1570 domain-containing protein n=1 Tax=Rubritalea tangerina TaxID=430798 RepID=A0ABW4ZDQ2_9BACT
MLKYAWALGILGLICGTLYAERISLREVGGKIYEGEIRLVRDEVVFFETDKGVVRMPMKVLNTGGRRIVDQWIRKKGGTVKYASWIGNDPAQFKKSWPRTVYGPSSIQLKKDHKNSNHKQTVYESAHYRFISNTKVEARVVQRFAVLFEATYKFVLALPINASAHYRDKGEKFTIYLFGDMESYHKAGGPVGSAGVYIPRGQAVLVPMPVLGVQWDGKKWEYKKGDSNRVLSHELTHQLCAGPAFASWYIEGGAEYVASTRYTHGVYHSNNGKQRVFAYVRDKDGLDDGSGRRLGSRIPMMSLESFMQLPYRQFAGGSSANKNYGVGLLLTYFFYHKDGYGDAARIKKYIQAVQQGMPEKEAQKHLLGKRSYAQLQEEFRKFCAQGGIQLVFPKR